MQIDILTLFPEFFTSPLNVSLLARAQKQGLVHFNLIQIRDFATDKHKKVDDRPFGGGPGMVLKPEPVVKAIRSCKDESAHVIYLSAQGKPLTANKAYELSKLSHLVLLCGHYEGIDERVNREIDEEISIGDYVLISGCTPSIVLIEAVCRFIPGFLGDEQSAYEESFQGEEGVFDYPQFTRPEIFEGVAVPPILLSGNHAQIAKWRKQQAYEKTKLVRPELMKNLIEG